MTLRFAMHRATKHYETTKTDAIISACSFDRICHLKQHDKVLAIIHTCQIVGNHGGGIWSFRTVRKYASLPWSLQHSVAKKATLGNNSRTKTNTHGLNTLKELRQPCTKNMIIWNGYHMCHTLSTRFAAMMVCQTIMSAKRKTKLEEGRG